MSVHLWKQNVPASNAANFCIEKNISLDDMSLEEYKKISPVFEEDIYEAISLKTCVEKRTTIGAPGKEAMEQVIAINEDWIANL